MLNKNKIRMMTRLAIYDKNLGNTDRKRAGYFKWDYVYFRNLKVRIGVLAGCMIIAVFYVLKKVLADNTDILMMDLRAEITKIIFYTIVALVVYTVIGTLVHGDEYERSKIRLENYTKVLSAFKKREMVVTEYDGGDKSQTPASARGANASKAHDNALRREDRNNSAAHLKKDLSRAKKEAVFHDTGANERQERMEKMRLSERLAREEIEAKLQVMRKEQKTKGTPKA